MAGDWIKVQISTASKPEVLRLARRLGVSSDDAFGKLVRFWGWVDAVSVDGVVDGVVDADVDAVVGAVGFCDGLKSVGWLIVDAESERISLPNFERHNGESAKKRAQKAKRQSEWRGKGRSVDARVDAAVDARVDAPSATTAATREEKRREDKKHPPTPHRKPPLRVPPDWDTDEFWRAWGAWSAHLEEVNLRPLGDVSAQAQLAELRRGTKDLREAIRWIRASIAKGWKSIYNPDTTPGKAELDSPLPTITDQPWLRPAK